MRPGVDVFSRALPVPPTVPTDTGVGFLIGPNLATGGPPNPPNPGLLHSMTDFVNVYGDRQGQEVSYDAADVFFREGGAALYMGSTTIPAGLLATQKSRGAKSEATSEDAPAQQVADPGIAAALAALTKDLGPGQVFIADPVLAADVANQSAILAHAAATNRVALLSTTDGDATTLTAAATALHSDANAQYGALFAPSAIVPGVTPGTTRTVPWAAVAAGIMARNDASNNPNVPSAGDLGISLYAMGLFAPSPGYTDTDFSNLNGAGCNMARVIYGVIETYGYRSIVDPTSQLFVTWGQFGNVRLNMAITAQAEAIGESYVFTQLDGRGVTIGDFGSELSSMLTDFYTAGALYGDTAQDAFSVNVGPNVNTPTTITNGELHAILEVCMAPMAEWVVIEIVKVPITQPLSAQAPPPSALAA
jgi:phage tail sheath protein FI